MKKLLFSLMFAVSISASCQILTIKNSSFNDSIPVLSGSEQWIDVKDSVVVDSSGLARLFCANVDTSGQALFNEVISTETMQDFYLHPQNSDGTFRVYFDVPWFFTDGFFILNYNFSGSVRIGRVATALSLPTLSPSIPNHTKTYLTLSGQVTTEPHGIIIEQTQTTRKLVYFP